MRRFRTEGIHAARPLSAASAVLSGKSPGPHAIEWIGAGFVPAILNRDIIDDVVAVEDRFLLGGGDRTFHLGSLLASAGKWLITGAMAAVGLITGFRALRSGGVRPLHSAWFRRASSRCWAWRTPVCREKVKIHEPGLKFCAIRRITSSYTVIRNISGKRPNKKDSRSR